MPSQSASRQISKIWTAPIMSVTKKKCSQYRRSGFKATMRQLAQLWLIGPNWPSFSLTLSLSQPFLWVSLFSQILTSEKLSFTVCSSFLLHIKMNSHIWFQIRSKYRRNGSSSSPDCYGKTIRLGGWHLQNTNSADRLKFGEDKRRARIYANQHLFTHPLWWAHEVNLWCFLWVWLERQDTQWHLLVCKTYSSHSRPGPKQLLDAVNGPKQYNTSVILSIQFHA